MAIRPATADDLPAIAAIYAHYVERTFATFDLQAPTAGDWAAKHAAAAAARHPWVVTEDEDGATAGYAIASTFNPRAAYATTVATAVYLHPDRTGRGLGGPLYAALLGEAAARGFHRAVAGVAVPNPASATLHARAGFTVVGTFAEVGHKLGAWRDVQWWQRAL